MSKKVIIIGAGIAGLSTGCYAQINGYESEIFDMHNIAGGLCTSWNRKGYVFDGCLHWLMGTKPGTSFYKYWTEIDALKNLDFYYHKLHLQLEDNKGRKVELCADIDKMEKQLLEIAPEDEALIKEFTAAVRTMMKMNMSMDKPQELYNFLDLLKMLIKMGPMMKAFGKLNSVTIGDFFGRFKNQFLKEALSGIMAKEYSLMIYAMVLATYAAGDAAWPMGGSLEFAKSVEKSYLNMGGIVHYGKKAVKILVENNRAVGIKLADGTEIKADFVVSAADGYSTIFKMLDGKYVDDRIKDLYLNTPLAPTSIQVSLGVDCDLSKEPETIGILLKEPYAAGGAENKIITFRHYCYDGKMAPKGKSVVTTILYAHYDYWENLYKNNRVEYNAQKKQIGEDFIKFFEERFPQAKGKVEVIDISTPYTYTRYTGTWKGVYMGWITTPENYRMTVPGRLPGLSNFYMAGQWANPSGGVPVGIITGRWTLMRLCKDDKRKFVNRKES